MRMTSCPRRPAAKRIRGAAPLLFLLLFSACDQKPPFRYDFEQASDLDNLEWKCGVLYERAEHPAMTGKSLKLTLYPPPEGENGYRGVVFGGFQPDWRRYESLHLEIHNPQPETLELTLRIDDREAPPYADRFNRVLAITPGGNRIVIPLAALATSGSGRMLDRKTIRQVRLFAVSPRKEYLLYLDNISLLAGRNTTARD